MPDPFPARPRQGPRTAGAEPIRIFISSPSDVRPERLKAERIVARLDREFAYHFHVEALLWEREPLVASRHPQEDIPVPHECEVVVVILWSRLGMVMPYDKFPGPLSKKEVTGTEWEFEDALARALETKGVPDLLLYRKAVRTVAELDDREALKERVAQLDLVEDFMGRWFRGANDKSVVAAAHSFATTAEFEEKLYDHLHAILQRRAGESAAGVAIRWHEPPFRALLSYEYEHAPVFFGRTRARNELRELLARRIEAGSAFVLVFGASGSGKSSLVKAGLLPDLALPGMIGHVGLVRRAVLRPSDSAFDPLAGLAAAILSSTALPELANLQYSSEQLAALLRRAPDQAALPIRQGLAEAGKGAGLTDIGEARLVIVLDQLEELFTIGRLKPGDREALVAALGTLAASGLVWVIATMRSDFFDRLETLPALAALSAEGRFLLLPPDAAEMGQIIRQPAEEAGVRFEHDAERGVSLDEIIRQAAATDGGALPLLSFLLDQLWQRRTEAGLLTFAAYKALGGLEGAIGGRAEQVFLDQPENVQNEFVPVLRELVAVEGRRPVARNAPLSLFAAGTPRRALVDALRDPKARLVVSDGDAEHARLRLAHEALLSHWARARDQVAADARDLELRGRLEDEAAQWRGAPRKQKQGRLRAGGLPLAEARALLARWGDALPKPVIDFIGASRRAAVRRRLRFAGTVAGALVALPAIVGIVWLALVWWGVRQVEAKLDFVPVPAGCFDRGSPDSEKDRSIDEGPVRHVCVGAFDFGRVEVTQEQWARVMVLIDPHPSFYGGDDRRPVESVSWNDVQTFIRLMSFFGRRHYRLPSEAEWEYAARAGTTASRYWGDNADDGCPYENVADRTLKEKQTDAIIANCRDGYAFTAPVGSLKPNPFGFYDMLGNVMNWTEDCYMHNYTGAPDDGRAVELPTCDFRVVRGGSWGNRPRFTRSAYRYDTGPGTRSNYIGVRLVRTP